MEEDFQTEGKECVDQERLKMKSKNDKASGGRCKRRGYETRSGPAAVEDEREEIAVVSSDSLKGEQKEEWSGDTQDEVRSSRRKDLSSWRRTFRGELEKWLLRNEA